MKTVFDEDKYNSKEIIDPKADLIISTKKIIDDYRNKINITDSKYYSLCNSIISKYNDDNMTYPQKK
jgi:hypothetical protein